MCHIGLACPGIWWIIGLSQIFFVVVVPLVSF